MSPLDPSRRVGGAAIPPVHWKRYPRDLEGAWLAIDDLREVIDGMRIADEVAMRVRAEIEGHRMFGATLAQRIIAGVVGLIAVADFVLGLVHVSGHH